MTSGPAYHATAVHVLNKLTEKRETNEKEYEAYRRGVLDVLNILIHGYKIKDGWLEVRASNVLSSMVYLDQHPKALVRHNLDEDHIAFQKENIVQRKQ